MGDVGIRLGLTTEDPRCTMKALHAVHASSLGVGIPADHDAHAARLCETLRQSGSHLAQKAYAHNKSQQSVRLQRMYSNLRIQFNMQTPAGHFGIGLIVPKCS